ncbi:hypothetical protein EXU57_24295 [Segetibacter sp. 3557_3]|uniref:hypothetical protein n=1 Tax=Segetibacter sp. 3557_3 TaxID=2547429 RepID=UPI001059044F|nr:hypothetical protein [Segetibacter sp. 3557_3]TDH18174.1 hypothetical protein EXU57_24295 [Segetibacter sp. 3557_3]
MDQKTIPRLRGIGLLHSFGSTSSGNQIESIFNCKLRVPKQKDFNNEIWDAKDLNINSIHISKYNSSSDEIIKSTSFFNFNPLIIDDWSLTVPLGDQMGNNITSDAIQDIILVLKLAIID